MHFSHRKNQFKHILYGVTSLALLQAGSVVMDKYLIQPHFKEVQLKPEREPPHICTGWLNSCHEARLAERLEGLSGCMSGELALCVYLYAENELYKFIIKKVSLYSKVIVSILFLQLTIASGFLVYAYILQLYF